MRIQNPSIAFLAVICLIALPAAAGITVTKYYDANANGENDNEPIIPGWRVTIGGGDFYTPVSGLTLPFGIYTVLESSPAGWRNTSPSSVTITANGGDSTVEFGNLCLGPGGGLSIGFWTGKGGAALVGMDDLAMLRDLPLKDGKGKDFDPAKYGDLKSWLQGARTRAPSMAYMLSAQLAVMKLNVFNGKVDGTALILAPGTKSANAAGYATVNAVMTEANTELALHPLTPSGNPYRAYQEALKNSLEQANSDQTFVQPIEKCPCTADADEDGALDCFDLCPADPSKTAPGTCGCGVPDTDSDGDGTPDCSDKCPADPAKIRPGTCGCGIPDTDANGDGVPDCNDLCPADPAKTEPGTCGCGVADIDGDNDGTPDCNDLCPADPNKVAAGTCGCGVADTDSDKDGAPDCTDGCPADPAKANPGACGCGTPDTDGDSDGTPDCIDGCPLDPNKIALGICGCGVSDTDTDSDGTPDCTDGCPTDSAKVAPGICGCGMPDVDTDGDGIYNCFDDCPTVSAPTADGCPEDLCPDDPNKVAPGVCGCGVADTDTDGDMTADCNDGCPFDTGKTSPGVCGCGFPDTDTDNDGTPNCVDLCPDNPEKTDPGQCGCYYPDTPDRDGDGVPSCIDMCDNNRDMVNEGVCGCELETDNDKDGVIDCKEACPEDPDKSFPGVCGCGTPDIDTDNDYVYDCEDGCINDPDKIEPGICGCGVPDTDSDSDGTPDCNDRCPLDPAKTAPGVCGCGVVDTVTDSDGDTVPDCIDKCLGMPDDDTDTDGVVDCLDGCPLDKYKTAPGDCGCGLVDIDSDGDKASDCIDGCPENPLRSDSTYGTCYMDSRDCGYVKISCDGGPPACKPYCVVDGVYYNPCGPCPPVGAASASSAQLLEFPTVTITTWQTLASPLRTSAGAARVAKNVALFGDAAVTNQVQYAAGSGTCGGSATGTCGGTAASCSSGAGTAAASVSTKPAATPSGHVDGADRGAVKLYALSTCSWCGKTTQLLDDLDVAYDYVYVDRLDPAQRAAVTEEVREHTTQASYPVTVIGDETIVGFKEATIRAALA